MAMCRDSRLGCEDHREGCCEFRLNRRRDITDKYRRSGENLATGCVRPVEEGSSNVRRSLSPCGRLMSYSRSRRTSGIIASGSTGYDKIASSSWYLPPRFRPRSHDPSCPDRAATPRHSHPYFPSFAYLPSRQPHLLQPCEERTVVSQRPQGSDHHPSRGGVRLGWRRWVGRRWRGGEGRDGGGYRYPEPYVLFPSLVPR